MDNVDRDPPLALGSTGEKAAAAAVKHPWQERQLPTPARTQKALWHLHSSLWEGVKRARGAARPPKGLLLPYCSTAATCELALCFAETSLINRCVYISHNMKLCVGTRACFLS